MAENIGTQILSSIRNIEKRKRSIKNMTVIDNGQILMTNEQLEKLSGLELILFMKINECYNINELKIIQGE